MELGETFALMIHDRPIKGGSNSWLHGKPSLIKSWQKTNQIDYGDWREKTKKTSSGDMILLIGFRWWSNSHIHLSLKQRISYSWCSFSVYCADLDEVNFRHVVAQISHQYSIRWDLLGDVFDHGQRFLQRERTFCSKFVVLFFSKEFEVEMNSISTWMIAFFRWTIFIGFKIKELSYSVFLSIW